MTHSVFIFRRDLRLSDNLGLNTAISAKIPVLPLFIFDPLQVESKVYRSPRAVDFMVEALEKLDQELKNKGSRLLTLRGQPDKVIEYLIKTIGVSSVYLNGDVSEYSKQRDNAIKKVCDSHKVPFTSNQLDLFLVSRPASDKIYQKFTYFYNENIRSVHTARNPHSAPMKNFINFGTLDLTAVKSIMIKPRTYYTGTPKYVTADKLPKLVYNTGRLDKPNSMWSAFIRFGVISLRQAAHMAKQELPKSAYLDFVRELMWRDFYYRVLGLGRMQEVHARKYVPEHDSRVTAWKTGKTGFPVVDAAMRQLVATGYISNRARLIVSNFLTKNIHANWKVGERFFMEHLTDSDTAANRGGWLTIFGGSVYGMPKFRILNPWLQCKKYDPKCDYVKKWVPELRSLSCQNIHGWFKWCKELKHIAYPAPILDFSETRDKFLDNF
jgi:deoxyribodipyrimidine photo-lyase